MAFYAHTNTITLSTTLTTPYPPSLLPLSISLPAPAVPTISYTTLPASDPLDEKLAPVLVVTEEGVKIVDQSGVLLGSTRVLVVPQASATGGGGGGQKELGRVGKMGWGRWSWRERWGVIGVACVAVVVLLAAAVWALWMRFGRGAGDGDGDVGGLMDGMRRGRLNGVRTGETGVLGRGLRVGDVGYGSRSGSCASSRHGGRGDTRVQEKIPISVFED